MTGECKESIAQCPYNEKTRKSFTVDCKSNGDTSYTRCPDGICRPHGACECVPWSGCQFLKFECPSGKCEDILGHCAKWGRCELDTPFHCGGGKCEKSPAFCPDRISAASFAKKSLHYTGKASIASDDVGKLIFRSYTDNDIAMQIFIGHKIFEPATISPFYTVTKPSRRLNVRNRARALQSKPAEPSRSIFDKPEDDGGNSKPYEALEKYYTKQKFSGDCYLDISYVGMSQLESIKNIFPRAEVLLLQAYYREKFDAESMPLHMSVYSTPVSITTRGRLDDNDVFGAPMKVKFMLNYLHMISRYIPIVVGNKKKGYIEYFSNTMCLASVDYVEKKFRCINRIPYDVTKNKADGLHSKHKQMSVTYEVTRPGTYVVIMKPKRGLADKNMKEVEMLSNPGSSFIYPILIVLFMTILIAFFYCLALQEHIKVTSIESQLLNFKLNQIKGTLPDYNGQCLTEKLESNVRFLDNPIFGLES